MYVHIISFLHYAFICQYVILNQESRTRDVESWPRGLKEKRDRESDRPKPPVLHDKPQGRQQRDSVDGNPSTFHCLRLWLVRIRL